tara:strand:+ start:920 stop:1141 length:222 start_codon:yes stop_codon:yes gene_type:complete
MKKNKTFEESLLELQSVIDKLEKENPPLDEMLKLYENGMNLMVNCREQLSNAEERVKTIIKENDKIIEKIGID